MAAQAASPAILRHRLGRDLRAFREARSLRLEDVAAHLGVAISTLSRIETGKAPTRTAYLYQMLDLFGVIDPEQVSALADLAHEGQRQGWHADYDDLLSTGAGHYLGLENAAALVRSWSVLGVPGLLQTADYAAAVIAATRPDLTADQTYRLGAIQLRRQEQARSTGRRLHAVIDEAALLRPVAPANVMADQMRHLATVAADPLVTVQVATLTVPLPVLTLPFTVLSFDNDPNVACCPGIGDRVLVTSHGEQVRTLHATFSALTIGALSATDSADLIRQLSTS